MRQMIVVRVLICNCVGDKEERLRYSSIRSVEVLGEMHVKKMLTSMRDGRKISLASLCRSVQRLYLVSLQSASQIIDSLPKQRHILHLLLHPGLCVMQIKSIVRKENRGEDSVSICVL